MLEHERRRIRHFNVTAHPTAQWVWRQVIEATPSGSTPRYLIRDRDRSYGGGFVARARAIGIETVLTPVRAPQANALFASEGVLFDDVEDILDAQAAGLVTIETPGVVVLCPIISEEGAEAPGNIQLSEDFPDFPETF